MSFIPSLTPVFHDINIITETTANSNATNLRDRLLEFDTILGNAGGKQVTWEDYTFLDISHRGCPAQAPEESLIAYHRCLSKGSKIIDCDLVTSSDNNLILIHDTTVDSITNGTGNVSGKTTSQLKDLMINSLTSYGSGHQLITINEFFATFKRKSCLFTIEPKDVQALLRMHHYIEAHGIAKERFLLSAFLTGGFAYTDFLTRSKALGYKTSAQFSATSNTTTASSNVASCVTYNVDYLVTDADSSDAVIAIYVASNIPVIAYTKNRRWDRQRIIGLGCKGLYSDSVEYIARTTPVGFSDNWINKSFLGMLPWNDGYNVANEAGDIDDTGAWGWGSAPSARSDGETVHVTLQGWASPLTYNIGTNKTINFYYSIKTTTSTDATRWGGIYVHLGDMGDRQVVDHTTNNTAYENFYLFLQRMNGTVDVFNRDAFGSSLIITQTASALSTGTLYHYRLAWSANKYSFSRLATAQDASSFVWKYNGGHSQGLCDYFSFGNRGQALRFSNVLITHQATDPY